MRLIPKFIRAVCCLVLLLLTAFPASAKGPEGVVRIGIFQFKPFNYLDNKGEAQGFNPALLQEIIRDESWTIEYIPGTWAEGLERLQNEEIDLMMSVAYSRERAKLMDYTYESVAELWGQVFIRPDSTIRNINDLDGKLIAVMNKDISARNFRTTAEKFDVQCSYLELGTHDEVFTAVQSGRAAAGVAPQHFGLRHAEQYNLVASSIMFSPFSIYFTAKKGRHHELLSEIDAHLSDWKRDETSFYYQALNTWLGWHPSKQNMPRWLFISGGILLCLLTLLFTFIVTLRKTVSAQTAELARSEERFRRFVNLANEGILSIDKNEVIDFVNPRMATMIGYSPDELLGLAATSIIFEEDHGEHHSRMLLRAQGKAQNYEMRLKAHDGSARWVLLAATPVFDKAGRHNGSFAMVTDISDRKRAEDELRLLHKRFLTVLDGIDSTIYVADLETYEILFMNKYMIELFGGDMTGKTCHEGLRNSNSPCSLCTNHKLLDESGNPLEAVVREDRHPVTKRWNIYRDKAIEWVDGRMVRLQIATDLTQIKELELQQRRYERNLQQTQRLETVGTLAGGIAHDFNNILSSIIGYTEIALDDELERDSPARESLENVLEAGNRARELIKRLLVFSRQGSSEVNPIRLTEVVEEAMNMVRATLPANIELCAELAAPDDTVLGNQTEIHQVVMNLCSNAAYAMQEEGGRLDVSLFNSSGDELTVPIDSSADQRYILLAVADNGLGIPEEMQSRIFDPFFSTKPKGEGTGLGLAVTHGIIEDLGGNITVESEKGKGTRFTISLPLAERSFDRQDTDETLPVFGDETILIVDDEPALLNMYRTSLMRQGYNIHHASTGEEGLELFRSNPDQFDIVITDQTMPGMTGDKMATELLAIRPAIPVVMLTGYSSAIDKNSADTLGITEFLYKPVSVREIGNIVRKILDEHK